MVFAGAVFLLVNPLLGQTIPLVGMAALRGSSLGLMVGVWISYILRLGVWSNGRAARNERFFVGIIIVIAMTVFLQAALYLTMVSPAATTMMRLLVLFGAMTSIGAYSWVAYFEPNEEVNR